MVLDGYRWFSMVLDETCHGSFFLGSRRLSETGSYGHGGLAADPVDQKNGVAMQDQNGGNRCNDHHNNSGPTPVPQVSEPSPSEDACRCWR